VTQDGQFQWLLIRMHLLSSQGENYYIFELDESLSEPVLRDEINLNKEIKLRRLV
jgi:hypothetical protein